jgi:hypothetical protein
MQQGLRVVFRDDISENFSFKIKAGKSTLKVTCKEWETSATLPRGNMPIW